jgi:hypothetical protein
MSLACLKARLVFGRAASGDRCSGHPVSGRRRRRAERLYLLLVVIIVTENLRAGCTGDCKIPDQLVRIGCFKPFFQVDINKLATNDRCNIERLVLVERALGFQRFAWILRLGWRIGALSVEGDGFSSHGELRWSCWGWKRKRSRKL